MGLRVHDDELPFVDSVHLTIGGGFVMARNADEPLEASRRFDVVRMLDEDADDTADPEEAAVLIFGSDEFGWCVYKLGGEATVQ